MCTEYKGCFDGQRTDRIGELITELAATADDDAKDELLGSLLGFLSADHARGEAQTVTQLAEILRALPEELLGRERTDRLKTTLDSLAKTSADDHTTGTSDPSTVLSKSESPTAIGFAITVSPI
ncbi:MAG: hypothetical protein IID33_17895 [Planctomycetes bacterium]|nr:hypothetical protein [Planctomycetota bacterium]